LEDRERDRAEPHPRDPAIRISEPVESCAHGLVLLLPAEAEPGERPAGVLAQQRILAVGVMLNELRVLGAAAVPERDERVPAQVARIVLRYEEAFVPADELLVGGLEPLDQRDVRLGAGRRRLAGTALLDPAVPRTDVLADVAAVDLVAELGPIVLRN